MTTAHINKIATAVPQYDFHQQFVEYCGKYFDDPNSERVFQRMVVRSNVSHRWGVMPDFVGFFDGDPTSMGIDRRMQAYKEHAPSLAIDSVDKLALGNQAATITHLVIVTCTGFFTPGIDLAIIKRCGLSSSVERTQVAFMGCFAGVNGLKLAHHIVRSQPTAKVLVVAIEVCSIHLHGSQNLDAALSHLIFGDGCAAALVTAEETGIAMDSFKCLITPASEELMTLNITSTNVEIFLSGQVPIVLGKTLKDPETMKLILGGAEKNSIDLWAIHPGGRSILDAVGRAVDLTADQLAPSRYILDNYGNLASATILFLFAELLRQNENGALAGSAGCALAFGPGLTTESMLFRAV